MSLLTVPVSTQPQTPVSGYQQGSIPTIHVEPCPSELPPNNTSSVDPQRLRPPSKLDVQQTAEKLQVDIHSHAEKLKNKAEDSKLEAQQANLQLKKKTFFIKLSIAVVASIILVGGIIATGVSGGAAAPFAVGMGIVATMAIADACCAAKDWHLIKTEKAGLPMGANALGNLFYGLLKALPIEDSTRKTTAKWSSLIIKTIISIGVLSATDFNADVFIESGGMTTPLMSIAGALTDIVATKAEGNESTAESVGAMQQKSQLELRLSEEAKVQETSFADESVQCREMEHNLEAKNSAEIVKLKAEKASVKADLETQQRLKQRWLTFSEKIPLSSTEGMEVLYLFSAIQQRPVAATAPRAVEFQPQALPLSAPNSLPAETSDTIKESLAKAKSAAADFKKAHIRHARNTFMSKVIRSVCMVAGLGLLSGGLVISIGDAIHAYKDWQAKKHGRETKPFGWDWIANEEYQRLVDNGKTKNQAQKRAENVSLGVRLAFSLGALLPAGSQHAVVEEISNAVNHFDVATSAVGDEMESAEGMPSAELDAEFRAQEIQQKTEVIKMEQITHTKQIDDIQRLSGQAHTAQARLMTEINEAKNQLAAVKDLNQQYQRALLVSIEQYYAAIEALLTGEFSDLNATLVPSLAIVG